MFVMNAHSRSRRARYTVAIVLATITMKVELVTSFRLGHTTLASSAATSSAHARTSGRLYVRYTRASAMTPPRMTEYIDLSSSGTAASRGTLWLNQSLFDALTHADWSARPSTYAPAIPAAKK